MPYRVARLSVAAEGQRIVAAVVAGHYVVHKPAVRQCRIAEDHRRNHFVRTVIGRHLHRVVDHINPVAVNHIQRRRHLVGGAVIVGHQHVVGHNSPVVLRAEQLAHAQCTGTMRGVYLVGHDAHVSVAAVGHQHIARVARHIVHLILLHRHVVHVLHLHSTGALPAEVAVLHRGSCRAQLKGAATDVHTFVAALHGAALHIHVVGVVAGNHGLDGARRAAGAVRERATLEVAVVAVYSQHYHVRQRSAPAHEVNVAQMNVARFRHIRYVRRRTAVRHELHSLATRLKHHIVFLRSAKHGRHHERTIDAVAAELHHQRVVNSAAAQRQQELVHIVVVGSLAAHVDHTAHGTRTHYERHIVRIVYIASIVQRLVVPNQRGTHGQRVRCPRHNIVETSLQRHTGTHREHRGVASRKGARPPAAHGVATVYAVVHHHRIDGLHTEVLQYHIHMRRLLHYWRVEVWERKPRNAGVVYQLLVLVALQHHHRPLHIRERRRHHLGVYVCVSTVVGTLAVVVFGLPRGSVVGHLQLHGRRVRRAVVYSLHHDAATGIEEGVRQVHSQIVPVRCLRYRQRPVKGRMHIVARERHSVVGRRHAVSVRHVLEPELVVRSALLLHVLRHHKIEVRDGSRTVACTLQRQRVYHPLTTRVGKLYEGEQTRLLVTVKHRRRRLRQTLHSSHTPILHPRP